MDKIEWLRGLFGTNGADSLFAKKIEESDDQGVDEGAPDSGGKVGDLETLYHGASEPEDEAIDNESKQAQSQDVDRECQKN